MFDKEELIKIKEFMDKLSQGTDPITNMSFPNDTILNNSELSRCFSRVSKLIIEIVKNSKNSKNRKLQFYITEDEKENVLLSDEAIPISTFTYRINDQAKTPDMRKLKATQITNWLLEKGYLSQIKHSDGKVFKVITEKAKSIGISSISKVNSYGRKYELNLYNKNAQKYILDNLNENDTYRCEW